MRKQMVAALAALLIGAPVLSGCGGEDITSDEHKEKFAQAVSARGIQPFEPAKADGHLVMSIDEYAVGGEAITEENVNNVKFSELNCWVTLGWYGEDYYLINAQDGRQFVPFFKFDKNASDEERNDAMNGATPDTLIDASRAEPSPDIRQIKALVREQYALAIPEKDQKIGSFC